MTPTELRAALKAMGWSARHLSLAVGLSPRAATNWEQGRSPVPPAVAAWLERRAAAHQQAMQSDPPPQVKDRPPCD